jgi:hypothetical protein
VRLTVVGVFTNGVERPAEGFALFAELFIDHRDSFDIHTCGDFVLIEDNIVRSSLIVDPINKMRKFS